MDWLQAGETVVMEVWHNGSALVSINGYRTSVPGSTGMGDRSRIRVAFATSHHLGI